MNINPNTPIDTFITLTQGDFKLFEKFTEKSVKKYISHHIDEIGALFTQGKYRRNFETLAARMTSEAKTYAGKTAAFALKGLLIADAGRAPPLTARVEGLLADFPLEHAELSRQTSAIQAQLESLQPSSSPLLNLLISSIQRPLNSSPSVLDPAQDPSLELLQHPLNSSPSVLDPAQDPSLELLQHPLNSSPSVLDPAQDPSLELLQHPLNSSPSVLDPAQDPSLELLQRPLNSSPSVLDPAQDPSLELLVELEEKRV